MAAKIAQINDYSLGRVPPLLVCGPRAQVYANPNELGPLQTDRQIAFHQHYMNRLEATLPHDSNDSFSQDTVGAIAMDAQGNMAAGVSSGNASHFIL